jgi:hypothetical protein
MTSPATNERVALILMKSFEAEATIDMLRTTYRALKVIDNDTYWTVANDQEIVVDMDLLAEEIGRPITVGEWLVVLSSYVGRPSNDATRFRVTAEMLQIST